MSFEQMTQANEALQRNKNNAVLRKKLIELRSLWSDLEAVMSSVPNPRLVNVDQNLSTSLRNTLTFTF